MKHLFAIALVLLTSACASPAHAWPVLSGLWGHGHAPPPALTLSINPASQMVTRVGAGTISTTVTYTAGGGTPALFYTTSVTPSLTVTNPGTTTPTFTATLTNGQNTTYTVTGRVHDSLGVVTPATATINFVSTATPPPGLALVIVPVTQTQTRSGAGAISADFTYVPSGGTPPYTLSTVATGLTITGGTTTTPNLSTTLLSGQDTTYPFTGTLNDSVGSTPATANGSVEFIANAVFEPLDSLARGMVGDNIASGQIQAPSNNVAPYTLKPKVVYGTQDIANLVAMGITYVRIPVGVQQVLPNLPFPTSYLLETFPSSGVWQPISTNNTKTVGNTGGCGNIYVSSACSVSFTLTYLDQTVAAMEAQGLAVDLVLFSPLDGKMPAACTATCPTSSVGGDKDLHDIMGPPLALYGYASYEDMLQAANLVLVNRYSALYPAAGQIFWELYNEPDYIGDGSGDAWQDVALWNAATISITSAIRGVDNVHWLISDCPQSAKAEHCHYLTPTSDQKTVYSFHKYDPSEFALQGSGANRDPYLLYPRPGSGDSAIGRPGGIAPAFMQFPAPVYGTPSGNTTTSTTHCSDSVPLPVGTPTTAWATDAVTAPTAHSMKVCRSGSGATSLVDYFTGVLGTNNLETIKSDLYSNTARGINLVTSWAAAGGHAGPLAASPLRIIAGEIGFTRSTDYLSSLQITEDLIDVLNTHGVVGGQAKIPWTWWAFSGVQFGFRPKTQPALSHWCLYPSGVLTGYDKDWYARLSYPQGSMTPNCSGGAYVSPGY